MNAFDFTCRCTTVECVRTCVPSCSQFRINVTVFVSGVGEGVYRGWWCRLGLLWLFSVGGQVYDVTKKVSSSSVKLDVTYK